MNSKLNAALETLKKNGIRVYTPDTLPECEIILTAVLRISSRTCLIFLPPNLFRS